MKRKLSVFLIIVLTLILLAACNIAVPTITFDAQNGSVPITVRFNGNFTMPEEPTRSGYLFDGWYTDAKCSDGNKWNVPETLTSDITVYAKWKKQENSPEPDNPSETVTYSVTFEPQNGNEAIVVKFDENFDYPCTPAKEGYTFGGWYTDANCGDSNEWINTGRLTQNITVYAKWSINEEAVPDKYTVTFDFQNGAATETIVFDENFAMPENPTKLNYDFGGWYTDIACSDGNEWQAPETLSQSITIYAKWTKQVKPDPVTPAVYMVTFNFQNGEADCTVNFDSTFVLPSDPEREGYTFSGWYTDANCSDGNEWNVPTELNFNITVYAKWVQNATPTDQATTLQQQMKNQNYTIGLPSAGTYDCLVVPIKFSNTTVTSQNFENLNIAFNGTEEQTGWESVSSYYTESSYGKLNLNFDIWGYNIGEKYQPYISSKRSGKYENMTDSDGYYNGDLTLLSEVLAYLSKQDIDLSHYDSDNDGTIDAVYLIYSADVDYDYGDFWWAYVSQTDETATYQGLNAGYYLFAGLDFMTEDVPDSGNVTFGEIDGLKINAATYIHETGHLLGLDDYYDYDIGKGCDLGLGGADMMDQTVGDHNVYSKIMLGWIEPTVISESGSYTIDLSDSNLNNNCLMISLDGSDSYFGEYLLIDLYSATGLNKLHADYTDYLYGSAEYGARIYHVSSQCDNPYSTDYYSFTNNNNSDTKTPLIKLVEADGRTTKNTERNYGTWAAENDLWQTGDDFGKIFSAYKTYSNQSIGFNIVFTEVTATSVTVTITFYN